MGREQGIVIIGAGIGGLTATIALRQQGFQIELYERASELKPVGAGLTIQPNAVLALRKLGLAERVERAGALLRAGALMRADGTPLTRTNPSWDLAREAGAPIVGIHRATLHHILLEELGRDAPQLGRACTGYEQAGDTVRARFADGAKRSYAALVGADGLRSAVRAQLVGDGEPHYAGYTSWRGICPDHAGLPADFGGEMWGRGLRFGGCVIDDGRFYWFAVANAPEGEREPDARAMKDSLLQRFAGWGNHVPELIAKTPADAILRTDIADRPPIERWGEGRVTLLGDAAHPMTPNLGQGACQAIEDALVLGVELGRASSLELGLRAYEAARRERANNTVRVARRLGAIGQWTHPIACSARDALFSVMPAALMKKQLLAAWKLPS